MWERGSGVYCDCVSSVERGRVFECLKLKLGCIGGKIEKRILVGNKWDRWEFGVTVYCVVEVLLQEEAEYVEIGVHGIEIEKVILKLRISGICENSESRSDVEGRICLKRG